MCLDGRCGGSGYVEISALFFLIQTSQDETEVDKDKEEEEEERKIKKKGTFSMAQRFLLFPALLFCTLCYLLETLKSSPVVCVRYSTKSKFQLFWGSESLPGDLLAVGLAAVGGGRACPPLGPKRIIRQVRTETLYTVVVVSVLINVMYIFKPFRFLNCAGTPTRW